MKKILVLFLACVLGLSLFAQDYGGGNGGAREGENAQAGCTYNNPPCEAGSYCRENTCVREEARQGCSYNNPPCEAGSYCRENTCVREEAREGSSGGGAGEGTDARGGEIREMPYPRPPVLVPDRDGNVVAIRNPCPDLSSQKEQVYRKCSEIGLRVEARSENGCVVAYACAEKMEERKENREAWTTTCKANENTNEESLARIRKDCYGKGMMVSARIGPDGCATEFYCKEKPEAYEKPGMERVASTRAVTCAADESLVKEYYSLFSKLEDARKNDDTETVRVAEARIAELKEKVNAQRERCANAASTSEAAGGSAVSDGQPTTAETYPAYAEVDKVYTVSAGNVVPRLVHYCNELKAWQNKRSHYEDTARSEEAMAKLSLTKEKLKNIFSELDIGIAKLKERCANELGERKERKERDEPETEIGEEDDEGEDESGEEVYMKPVAPTETREISEYYKERMTRLMSGSDNIEMQVSKLKELRTEIDGLIKELLERKQRIEVSEVGGLVDKIEVTPGKVKADSVEVSGTDRAVIGKIARERAVEVIAKADRVVLREGGVEAEAQSATLTEEGVSVGDEQVLVSPSEAAGKVSAIPKKIRLLQEGKKPVYKVATEKDARILGILPVKMQKETTIDAQNGEVTREEKPWWSAIAREEDTAPALEGREKAGEAPAIPREESAQAGAGQGAAETGIIITGDKPAREEGTRNAKAGIIITGDKEARGERAEEAGIIITGDKGVGREGAEAVQQAGNEGGGGEAGIIIQGG